MKSMYEKRKDRAKFLYSQGKSIKEISNIMLFDENTIKKYLESEKNYNNYKNTQYYINKIEKLIFPYKLTEDDKQNIKLLEDRFSQKIINESIQAGFEYYLKKEGGIKEEKVRTFLSKLAGIAFNKTKNAREN